MKKLLLCPIIALLLGTATFLACSNNKDTESKKGRIETLTDKTAKEAVRRINTPIEKARSVKKQQEDRLNAMEETFERKKASQGE